MKERAREEVILVVIINLWSFYVETTMMMNLEQQLDRENFSTRILEAVMALETHLIAN